jgi:hypothetical protein
LLSLQGVLPKLFRVAITDRGGQSLDTPGERLKGALISWDCQEDLDVIERPLQSQLEALFEDYLRDADRVSAVLPWKLQKAAHGRGEANGSQPSRSK